MGLILTSRRLLPAPVAAIELVLVERKQRKSSVFKRFRGETDAIGSTSVVRRVAIMFRGRVSAGRTRTCKFSVNTLGPKASVQTL